MAEVRTLVIEFLRAPADEAARTALASALEGLELPAARLAAKDDAASPEAVARVIGLMLLASADQADVVDAAKAAAQRAPRSEEGNEVALVAGAVLWALVDQQVAEPYFRRVRRSAPGHTLVLGFYRDWFAKDASATHLIQVLVQARRASRDPETRFALAAEVATLAEERLASPDRAIEMWRSVVREDGYDPRASSALMRLYREGKKWRALVDLLKEELERIDESDRPGRIEKLLEIAALYRDELKLDTMALATLQRILEIDPQHPGSLESLAETYVKAGRFNDLLGVYAKRIAAQSEAGDVPGQVELLRKVAEIWLDRLGNPQRALEPLRKVLALVPRDTEARNLLARIHEERRDFRALISLRREDLEYREGDEALELRIELACLAEDRLGDRREAIAAWNSVLSHHGDIDKALAALARLYEREGRWPHAAEILHRKLRTCNTPQSIALLQHLGSLYTDRIRNRDAAIRVWCELLRLAPGHDKATRRLRDAYMAEGEWDALTALYEEQGRLHDVVEVLQSAADRVSDIEERVALYRRVAGLCNDRLGQPERALKALERTLAIQPDNLDVARELLPIYREQSNWARLMTTYEVLLKEATKDDERLELIAAMQEVAEHKLASHTLALHWAAQAYRTRPTDVELREGLERAAECADGWDELTSIYEERIAVDSLDDQERLGLLEKLAVIARDRLFKPDDAQRYFRRIVACDPANAAAMEALEQIYSRTQRWDDLGEVYRKRLEVSADGDERLGTLRSLAKIQEEQLADLEAATESFRSILEIVPEDAGSLESLARIFRNRGNWEDLAAILGRQLELSASDSTRVPLIFELSDVHATRLQHTQQAVQGFLSVLEIDANHRATVDALEALRLSDPSTSLAVMQGLLPYYKRAGDRPKESEAMEVIVAAEQAGPARIELLQQLAAIYEQMDERRDDALRIRDQLFRGDPSQWEGRQILQRLGAELNRMADVAVAYEAALDGMAKEAAEAEAEGRTLARDRAGLRRDLLLEYGAMLRDRLGRPGDAEQAYSAVLEHDETHEGAYTALEALLRERSANEDLVALYRRRVDVTFNQGEQKELLSRIIEISRTVLADRGTAVATAEELLDLIPDDLATISLLAEMYAEGSAPEDYVKLEEALGRQAELVDDAVQAREIRVRRATLRMQYLGDAFGAVDLLGQVVGEAPEDEEATRLLEELLAISDVQLQACALLEPIYERSGDHHGRVRILQVRREQAEAVGAADDAVGYLLRTATIFEHDLGDRTTAFSSAQEAYLMDPTRLDARQEVERLGLALGLFSELATVWRQGLANERVADPTLKIDLTTRLARLLDEHLRDQEGAREAYSALLTLDPPDASLALEAVSKLCRLHLEAGDGVALIAAKRQLLRFCDTQQQRVDTRLEIAQLQLDLLDRVGSALTFSEVLDMQPSNVVALDALERLFQGEREWERLVEVVEHRIGVTSESRAKAVLWRQLGEIQRDELEDVPAAISAFQSVLDLKVGREETANALRALIAAHEVLEHWPDVEEALRRLTSIAENEEVRVELLTRTAIVLGQRLSRTRDALDLLKRVLDLSPSDTTARGEVRSYLEQEETRSRASNILTPLYEAEQNWPAMLELEELAARKQPSGRRRLKALLKVAGTQEEKIGDTGRAFGVLCEAMAEAADQPELEEILEKVERLGAESERAQGLLDAYTATVGHILDSKLQKQVLHSQGSVALERLGQLDVAGVAYRRVLELAPDDSKAADALEQIYLRQDEYQPLADLLVARADRAGQDEARDDALMRAATILRTHLNNPEDAIRLYERLSADALSRGEIQDVLEPLYEQTERWRELSAHLNRKLSRISGKEAVETHLRLGRLYGQMLEDPDTGIKHLSSALKLDPDHAVGTEELDRYLEDPTMRGRVAEVLEPVFAAVADWDRLIQIQEIRLEDAADEAGRVRILMRIAQIEEEQLEDLERAMGSYERLFKEQPTSRSVRDQLSRLAGVLGQTERYATLLTEHVQGDGAGDDSDGMLAVVRTAADLWSGMLRQPTRAVPLLQRIRDANPEDTALFSALESALTQADMWKELGEAYWAEVDSALAEERQIELLRKVATVAHEMLEDATEEARAYQRMLEIRPESELARSRLEKLYLKSERHQDLLDLLRERVDRTESADMRAAVSLEIAKLQEGSLDDPQGAVDTLEGVLADSPDDANAVRMLEVVAQSRRELRKRILGLLRPIYERTGNVRRIVEIDEWQLGQVDDPHTRHEIFREMAALQARSPDTAEAAFRTLCRALAEPGPEQALEELDGEIARMAEILEMRPALADALTSSAAADALESDIERRLDLLVRAASIMNSLSDTERAADTLRAAIALREDYGPALVLFDEVLTRLGYHDELSSVLRKRADTAEQDSSRVELLRRLAILLEEVLVRPVDAEQAWKDLLENEPSDREALRRLSRVYEASGSTKELIDVLERQIDASTEDQERRDLRMQLANLQRETVGDRAAEIDVLRSLLVDAPADDDALAALVRALVAQEQHGEAADVVQERAALSEGDDRKAALMLEAARMYRGPLDDVPSALERYGQVLGLQPGADGALGDLVVLAQHEDHFEAAGNLVMGPLEEQGRSADLGTVLAARAKLTEDPQERGVTLRKLAQLRLGPLDDHSGALAAYVELLDVAGEDDLQDVLEHSGRIAVELGRGMEHLDVLGQRSLNEDVEGGARVTIALFAANLAEEVLGEPGRALAVLRPLIEASLATPAVCERVERLGRNAGDSDAVVIALKEANRQAEEPAAQGAGLTRLGDVELERGGFEVALECYRDAFELTSDVTAVQGLERLLDPEGARDQTDPPLPGLLDALEGCYQTLGDRSGQARVTQRRLTDAEPSERARLLEQLGTLRDEGGGTPAEALEAWGELLSYDVDSANALERTLVLGRGQPQLLRRAVELMSAAAAKAHGEGHIPVALLLRTAEVQLGEVSDPNAAMHSVGIVLEDQAEHPEALHLLVQASRAAGAVDALHDALTRSAQVQSDPSAAVALWTEASSVAETAMAQPELAVADLEQLLATDDSDVQAWQKLLALLTAASNYEPLADAISRRVAICDTPQERRDLRYRLANVLVDKLERSDDAIVVYQDMIGDQPDDIAAIGELEILLRRLERWDDTRDVLERKLDAVDGQGRLAVLEELAQLSEHRLGDAMDAVERYQQIVSEVPAHPAANAALDRLLTAEERWVDLSELLDARAKRQRSEGNLDGYRATTSQLAELQAAKLEYPEQAKALLDELLEEDPSYVPALLAKAAVFESLGEEGAMQLTLHRAAELEPQGSEGAMLQLRLATLTRNDVDKQRTHLEKALELDPAHYEAASLLLNLCRKEERWEQATYMLELVAGRCDDSEQRQALTLERVDIMLKHLGDSQGALRVLRPLYEASQDDVEVNHRIADALFAADRFEEAAGMYTWLIDVGRRSKRNKALAHHLTRVARISLDSDKPSNGEKDQLIEAYRIDTTNVETLMTLGQLHERSSEWRDALKIYRTMLLQNADHSGLLRRGDIYIGLARAHVALEEKPKARAMLRRGLEEDSGHPELGSQLAALDD